MKETTSDLRYPGNVNEALLDLVERVENGDFTGSDWYRMDLSISPSDSDNYSMKVGDYSLGLFVSKGYEKERFDQLCSEQVQGLGDDAKCCWIWLDGANVTDGTLNAACVTKNFSADDVDQKYFANAADRTLHMFDANSGLSSAVLNAFGATKLKFTEEKL